MGHCDKQPSEVEQRSRGPGRMISWLQYPLFFLSSSHISDLSSLKIIDRLDWRPWICNHKVEFGYSLSRQMTSVKSLSCNPRHILMMLLMIKRLTWCCRCPGGDHYPDPHHSRWTVRASGSWNILRVSVSNIYTPCSWRSIGGQIWGILRCWLPQFLDHAGLAYKLE